MIKKLKTYLPNWQYISAGDVSTVRNAALKKSDFVFFVTAHLSHKLYYAMIAKVQDWNAKIGYLSRMNIDYNDSAQKTPAVRKNVRGMNAPITNNATIIPTGFSSGIVGFSWPDVLQNAVIRCIALLFQEKHFR